jgi:hypothetical protein
MVINYSILGVNDIKSHRFFASISLKNILNKKINPPFIPSIAN